VLIWPLGVGGLALATALSSSLNAWRLMQRLGAKLGAPLWPDLARPFARMLAAAGMMGLACEALWLLVGRSAGALGLLVVVVGGMIAYGASGYLVGVEEVSLAARWMIKPLLARLSSSA